MRTLRRCGAAPGAHLSRPPSAARGIELLLGRALGEELPDGAAVVLGPRLAVVVGARLTLGLDLGLLLDRLGLLLGLRLVLKPLLDWVRGGERERRRGLVR